MQNPYSLVRNVITISNTSSARGARRAAAAQADTERRTHQVEELRKVERRERGGRRAAADAAMAALRRGGGDTLEVAFLADPGRFAATHAVLVPYAAWGETGRTSKAYTATVLAEVMGGGEENRLMEEGGEGWKAFVQAGGVLPLAAALGSLTDRPRKGGREGGRRRRRRRKLYSKLTQ